MKILFLIGSLSNSGGTERMLTFQANYFKEKFGYNISILTYDQQNQQDFFQLSDEINRISINIGKKTSSNKMLKRLFAYSYKRNLMTEIEKILLKNSFDICICFGLEGGFLYKIKDNSKKIREFHFSKDFYQLNKGSFIKKRLKYYNFLNSVNLSRKYDRIVVLTETDKAFWKNHLSNVLAINNPIVIDSTQKSTLQNKIAISVGRLSREKGFDRLIEIWDSFAKDNNDWELHIYGNGSQKGYLEDMIKTKNLGMNVKIFEPVRNVEKIYEKGSIYLMTSRFEGFGLVLIEAMSFGLPIIAFDATGPRELVENNYNGYLIENDNNQEFVNKLELLTRSIQLREIISKNSLKVAGNFEPDRIMNQWKNLFNEVLKK